MTTYKVVFQKPAQKFIKRQDKQARLRLYKAIYGLPDGDTKKLKGVGLYRLRVGSFRVIYAVDDSIRIISVENIDNRGDAYKRM